MNFSKSFLLTAFCILVASSSFAASPDFGDNNKPYQACIKACVPVVSCNSTNTSNTKSLSFSDRVECSNRQLNCDFACKDKYNVQ